MISPGLDRAAAGTVSKTFEDAGGRGQPRHVWFIDRVDAVKPTAMDDWPIAPRLLADVYSALDAVVFGSLLISLLKHADRVRPGTAPTRLADGILHVTLPPVAWTAVALRRR